MSKIHENVDVARAYSCRWLKIRESKADELHVTKNRNTVNSPQLIRSSEEG